MTPLFAVSLIALLVVLALAAYVDRVYSESGKFLAREYQDNIDAWEQKVEPRLRLGRESIALTASVLRQLSVAGISILFGLRLARSVGQALVGAGSKPMWTEVAVNLFEVVILILLFDRLIPQVLFARTRGLWVVRVRPLLQALFYLVLPVTLVLGLLLSIAALAEPEDEEEKEHPSEAMDALLEAGEEEGILEESDRELVRSVVEFGDKIVRDVMTPRPQIFAVPGTLTLEEFTAGIAEHAFSRVPVYGSTLDQVTGIAFAHDLLQVRDADAASRTVAEIQRPAAVVPETKKLADLLPEMQREKQHMRLVIDEYGGVAGLVTIEDLLEAIVGSIADEHDEATLDDAPRREADGAYIVSGTFEVDRLRDLFREQTEGAGDGETATESEDAELVPAGSGEREDPLLRLTQRYEAASVGGLVSEIAGHIPLPGEVIEDAGLRLEVLASTDRRIDRIRVSLSSAAE